MLILHEPRSVSVCSCLRFEHLCTVVKFLFFFRLNISLVWSVSSHINKTLVQPALHAMRITNRKMTGLTDAAVRTGD